MENEQEDEEYEDEYGEDGEDGEYVEEPEEPEEEYEEDEEEEEPFEDDLDLYEDEEEDDEPIDFDEAESIHHESEMIHLEEDTEREHMANFKKISEDLKIFEEEYSNCIKDIEDSDYTEERIEECVGKDFCKVILDIKYETLKIMSRADSKMREVFVNLCYIEAGLDEQFSISCDIMERNGLDMIWGGLHFVDLFNLNRAKYLSEYGVIPKPAYKAILETLEGLSVEFFELLDEVDSHKEVTLIRIKTLIDDRTKLIVEEAKQHEGEIVPKIINHTVEIKETIEDNDLPDEEDLPDAQIENENPEDFEIEGGEERKMKQTKLKKVRRKTYVIHPVKGKKLLPIHQKTKKIVRKKLNAHRGLNSDLRYTGLNSRNHSSNGRYAPKSRYQILKKSDNKLPSVLKHLGKFNLGSGRSKNVHTTFANSRIRRFK